MKNLTEIIAIIDKSSSMSHLKNDVIGGFNGFIEEQKKVEGDAILSVVMFNSGSGWYYKLCDGINVHDFKGLNDENYNPNSCTALYDAIGKTLVEHKQRIKSMPKEDRPSRTILAILTDGEENSSNQFSKDMVFEKIQKREKKGWLVLYLGANQDAFQEGGKIGIHSNKALNYSADSDGMAFAMNSMSKMSGAYRSASKVDYDSVLSMDINDYTDDQSGKK